MFLFLALAPHDARAGSNDHQAGDCPPVGPAKCGDPIVLPTGNHFEESVDFKGPGANALEVTRYYNSIRGAGGAFGNWSWTYDRSLFITPNRVDALRPDGKTIYFVPDGSGGWKGFKNLDMRLTRAGATWTLRDADDNVETFTDVGSDPFRSAALQTIRKRNGYTQTMHYDAAQRLDGVTDSFGRSLAVAYGGLGYVSSITAPGGLVMTYTTALVGGSVVLTKVSYSTTPATSVSYLYENLSLSVSSPPLTAIIDEKGARFASWTYDDAPGYARATSSQHAGGADRTTVLYVGALATQMTVTGPLGQKENYSCPYFIVSGSVTLPQCKQINRLATASTPAAVRNLNYDANGYLASQTDWKGNLTQYVNDARGNETSRTEAAGTPLARTITTLWHPTLHLPTRITEPNRVTTFTYDARGNLLNKTITAGVRSRSYSYTYGAFDLLLTETDPRGNVTRYAYDAKGNMTRATNALGQVTTFTNYDGAGRLLRSVDPNGLVSTFTYDARGRMTSRSEGALKTSYVYDAAGNVTRVTLPDGSFFTLTYDTAHRLIGIRDALGNRIAYTLDAAGNLIRQSVYDPANVLRRTQGFAYDSISRLVKSITAQGQTTNFAYDSEDNLTSQTDPLAHKTSYAYDALNRLAQTLDAKGGRTLRAYDANDHVTRVTDPRALNTAYAWNGLDEQPSMVSPDTGTTTRTYDAAGNVLTSTDARGRTTTFAYDALNRLIRETFADASSVAYQYDQGANGVGHLTKITDPTGSTTYTYDINGHVTRKTQAIGALTRITSYAYNAGGRLASITYPSGKVVTYAYDAARRVVGLTAGAQPIISAVTYHPFGAVTGWTFGNGATYRRTIDGVGRITGLTLPGGNSIALTYDAASRITRITNSALPTKTFGYDALDQLISYAGGALTQSYAYDANGNRISASLKNGATTSNFTYAFAATNNRLASIAGASNETFAYDAAGNTASRNSPSGNYAFVYNARGRLAQATIGALTKTYAIDGLGQRVLKANPANANDKMHFVHDEAGHLLGEYVATGAAYEETVWLDDLPVATLRGAAAFYVAPDHLGAPHQITNAAQTVVWRWDRDPFGRGAPTGPLFYNLRFPGQYYDSETGLNYNYFRDYDPRLGRYVQSDPIGLEGGVNTYIYALNNPANMVDPDGLSAGVKVYLEGGPFKVGINITKNGVKPFWEVAPKWSFGPGHAEPYVDSEPDAKPDVCKKNTKKTKKQKTAPKNTRPKTNAPSHSHDPPSAPAPRPWAVEQFNGSQRSITFVR